MNKSEHVIKKVSEDLIRFWCPGCEEWHMVDVSDGRWVFNGNFEKPTVIPSILVSYKHPKGYSNEDPAPEDYDGEYVRDICHSFVTNGEIRFLGDCTHELAGQTVTLTKTYEHRRNSNKKDEA